MISFVSPHYNGGGHLEKMLLSLSQLKEKLSYNFEWIIVDDCSTDSSYEVAKKIENSNGWVRLLQLDKNSGPGVARIRGAAMASYEQVFLLDVDDEIILESSIDFIEFAIREKDNFDFFYCPLLMKKITSKQQPALPAPQKKHVINKPTDFIRFGFPQPSSLILNKDFYLLLDKGIELPWGEDFYTYMSIAKAGTGIRWKQPVSVYIVSPSGRGAALSFENRIILSRELFKICFNKGNVLDSLLFSLYITIRHIISYLYKAYIKK